MDVQLVPLIATVANLVAIAVAGGALLLIAWQPTRDRASGSFALFLVALMIWSLASVMLGNPEVISFPPTARFNILVSGLAVAAVAFYAFAIDFCAVQMLWARRVLISSPVVGCVLLVLLWTGNLFTGVNEPTLYAWEYQILPLGLAAVAYVLALYALAFYFTQTIGDRRARPIEHAALLMLVGQVTNAAPAVAALNLDALAAAGAVALMGRAMLRAQFLAPLADAKRQLRVVNQDLRQAIIELSSEREHGQKLRDEVRQATSYKAEFLANMSHELRTPLNSIVGYSELLLQGLYGPLTERQADRVGKIHRNGYTLLALINDILDLSKIEAGRLDLSPSAVDLPALVQEIADVYRPEAEAKGLALTVDAVNPLPVLLADATRIRQVLTNLLSNAVKFTKEGGVTLRVHAARVVNGRSEALALPIIGWLSDGNWVVFSVTDTGIGIAPEDQAAIFDEFSQIDSSASQEFQGTGLGLAITKKLVELHDGRIWLKSALNQGSTFFVALPADAGGQLPGRPGVAAASNGQRETVLVITDIPKAAEILSARLEREGYRALAAHDGSAGIEMAGQRKPDVVLVDVTMPGMNGWQAVGALRANPVTACAPAVAVAVIAGAPMGFPLGATDCIDKPVPRDALLEALTRADVSLSNHAILIVDDNPDDRDILSTHLAAAHFPVQAAGSGQEAMRWLAEHRAALVLLNLAMPGMSGFETLTHIRGRPATQDTPVIMLAARGLTPEEEDSLNARIVAIIKQQSAVNRDLLARVLRIQTAT